MAELSSLSGFGLGPTGSWYNGNISFGNAFDDMGSLMIPETMTYAHRWVEYVAYTNGTYRQAIERTLSYFITDIEVTSKNRKRNKLEDDEKDRYEVFFRDVLGVYKLLHNIGRDYQVYGNSFISVIAPFKRYLFCNKCSLELPLAEVYKNPIFKFQWNDFEFHAKCPKCKYSGIWGHVDRKGHEKDISVKRWNIHEIELLWDPMTDQCDYIWKIPAEYRKMIREGKLYHLERANWEVIQAIKHGNHLRFSKDYIFHLKEDSLAGIRNRGWGISRILTNFRQVWYVQVLHRYNEAIALDYVIPFRLITPPPTSSGGGGMNIDPINNMNLGGFMARVGNMLRTRRRDPAAWFTLPFPVQYQSLGGDATTLAPRDLLDQGLEVLLNNIGIPVELYKGSLQLQSAPAALRLFESTWSHLTYNLNKALGFIARKVGDVLSWEPVNIRLMRVTHADDLNRQMAKLQLMMGKQISQSTGLKSVGLSYEEETDKLMSEEEYMANKQQELQERMEGDSTMQQMNQPPAPPGQDPNAQQSGGQGGGDQPMPPPDPTQQVLADLSTGDNTPITPQELQQKAQTIAYKLLGMDESARQSAMTALKRKDPTVHALVKICIENIRSQTRNQAGNQAMKQNFGGS